jgi:hypothetical protein
MNKTRLSLGFLASYLLLAGAAFFAIPELALRCLLAEHAYETVFVRFLGAVMMALALLIVQIIRHRVEALYTTTLVVRLLFLAAMGSLYLRTQDRFFVVISGFVILGILATGVTYVLDRRARSR